MSIAQRIANLSAPRWAFVPLPDFVIAFASFGTLSSALAIAQAAFDYWPFPVFAKDAASGLLFNSVHQGQTLAIIIVALVIHRLYWLIPGLLPGLYLAHSRGAWLALAFGIVASRLRYPIVLLVFVLTLGVAYTSQPGASDLERLQIWRAVWANLTLWGNGAGSLMYMYIGNPATKLSWVQYAHNDYLQAVFEYGVWAVIPFAVVAYAASRSSARDWPILVTFLFLACFSMPMHMPIILSLGLMALITTLGAKNA